MRTKTPEVKRRSREKAEAGFTNVAVAQHAGVSERFVYFWYRGERSSAKVANAHNTLYARWRLNGRKSLVPA